MKSISKKCETKVDKVCLLCRFNMLEIIKQVQTQNEGLLCLNMINEQTNEKTYFTYKARSAHLKKAHTTFLYYCYVAYLFISMLKFLIESHNDSCHRVNLQV